MSKLRLACLLALGSLHLVAQTSGVQGIIHGSARRGHTGCGRLHHQSGDRRQPQNALTGYRRLCIRAVTARDVHAGSPKPWIPLVRATSSPPGEHACEPRHQARDRAGKRNGERNRRSGCHQHAERDDRQSVHGNADPPVAAANAQRGGSSQPSAGVSPTGEVLGAGAIRTTFMLDGVDANDSQAALDFGGFRAALPVPLDSVQEFRTTVAGRAPIRAAPPVDRSLWSRRVDRTSITDLYMSTIATRSRPRTTGSAIARASLARTWCAISTELRSAAGSSRSRFLLRELGRAQGPNGDSDESHSSVRDIQAGHRAVPDEQRPDRLVDAGRSDRGGPDSRSAQARTT